MAGTIAKNCKLYLDGYDLSGSLNRMRLGLEADAPDNTCFGATHRSRATGGLIDTSLDYSGFWEAGTSGIETVVASAMGASKVVTVCPYTGAETEAAYSCQALHTSYAPIDGSVGDMLGINIRGAGKGRVIRGTIMTNAARTETGHGTAIQLGEVTASQYVYAALHVYSVTGAGTLDVVVQSDSANNFPSALTKITFAQAAAVGAQWGTPAAGAIADTWWRADWTIAGFTSVSFIVTVAIA